MTDITELTTGSRDGTGVFDQLMQSVDLHIQEEFQKHRIKGPEYAQVYLGSLQSVMERSIAYLLSKDQQELENQLLAVRLEMAAIEKDTLLIQKDIAGINLLRAQKENLLIEDQRLQMQAQTKLIDEQVLSEKKRNELDGIMDQEKAQIVAGTVQVEQQTANLVNQDLQTVAETSRINAQKNLVDAQVLNAGKEGTVLTAQAAQIDQQTSNLVNQDLQTVAETSRINSQKALVDQQVTNAITEETVLKAQKCKLDAEFDLLSQQKLKAVSETTLLAQKHATEKAQVDPTNVSTDSIIGRQKELYKNQAEGFIRDAEQKTARIMADTWNVRKTTDPNSTLISELNGLEEGNIGRAISKLLTGINA